MDCGQTEWLSNREYLQAFNRRVAEERIPLSGSISLTHRCNLRCAHCYLGSLGAGHEARHREMTTAQVTSLIDQATEAGCLYLLITGGEPLIRPDFEVIYRHARTSGLLVTVFTNGTLITDQVVEVFEDLPPRAVEITLLGATAETFDSITGVEGSYERCLMGIERLLGRGVHVRLKTMLMTVNRHEFAALQELARGYGCDFRFDAVLFPRLDGDRSPLALRVPPQEAVARELAEPDRVAELRKFYDRFEGKGASDAVYQCGAGVGTFHIDPYGNLQPCLMASDCKHSLRHGFEVAWREAIPASIRERRARPGFPCSSCEIRVLCNLCPPLFKLETGAEDIRSDYVCEMAEIRWRAIQM